MTDTNYIWRLRTSCTVQRINESALFEVHWFHKNSTGTVIDIGRPEDVSTIETQETVLFGNHLMNQPFTNEQLGEYWCQIVLQPLGTYLGAGNTVTILPPDSYDTQLITCSSTVTVSSTVCADEPPPSLTMATSIPTSISTVIPTSTTSTISTISTITIISTITSSDIYSTETVSTATALEIQGTFKNTINIPKLLLKHTSVINTKSNNVNIMGCHFNTHN